MKKVKYHKLDKTTKEHMIYKRKAKAILAVFIGALWMMQIAGWFSAMPYNQYFVPAVIFVGGGKLPVRKAAYARANCTRLIPEYDAPNAEDGLFSISFISPKDLSRSLTPFCPIIFTSRAKTVLSLTLRAFSNVHIPRYSFL